MPTVYLDTETFLISYPDGIFPEPISLAYGIDGGEPKIIHCRQNKQLAKQLFLRWLTDDSFTIVGHNIIFDIQVLLNLYDSKDKMVPLIFNAISKGRIRDTYILAQCNYLAFEGPLYGAKFSLAALSGMDEESKVSSESWRFRYSELADTPIQDWPEKALQYALDDITATRKVYKGIHSYSINMPELHTGAAFALSWVTRWGCRIDNEKAKELLKEHKALLKDLNAQLIDHGLMRPDTKTRDQDAIRSLCEEVGITERTDKGAIKTDKITLEKFSHLDPRLGLLMEHSKVTKIASTFLPTLLYPRIHCNYNVILNTLRTSCRSSNYYKYKGQWYGKRVIRLGNPYPSINVQQIPGKSTLRNLFLPEEGHSLVTIDYGNLELVCCSQACYNLFKLSDMREILNEGINLHDVMGHIIYNDSHGTTVSIDEYKDLVNEGDSEAKLARKAAKVVNLGVPGGQGVNTMYRIATENFKLPVTINQIRTWYKISRQRYREFDKFFGIPYVRRGIMEKYNKFPMRDFGYINNEWGVYLTGKSYTACGNSILMQTPAAIGTKRALIALVLACFTPSSPLYQCELKAFVHDEFVLSGPTEKSLTIRDEMARIMLEEMATVCPDVRLSVEALVQPYWDKEKGDGKKYEIFPKIKEEATYE